MMYLNERDIKNIGINWDESIEVIEKAVECIRDKEFAQPVKPYLRFKDLTNRIIAMPAFVGKEFDIAGIKWIASFPKNIEKNIPRAHSVVILNDANTGEVKAVINTALLSIIRTASVSGLMVKHYDKARNIDEVNVGIVGWGPIGQHHFKMITSILKDRISKIYIYDIREIDKNSIDPSWQDKVAIAKSWEEAYDDSDIFMTCTVSKAPYINKKPKEGSLILNVSLRDFKANSFQYVKDNIIVDDWEEVCRENTDIENFSKEKGLRKEDTQSIVDIVCNNYLQKTRMEDVIMFNPMGMAIFDIAIGSYYLRKGEEKQIGQFLE